MEVARANELSLKITREAVTFDSLSDKDKAEFLQEHPDWTSTEVWFSCARVYKGQNCVYETFGLRPEFETELEFFDEVMSVSKQGWLNTLAIYVALALGYPIGRGIQQ